MQQRWDANLKLLRDESKDPLFWTSLLAIAKALQKNDDRYINDHNERMETMAGINVCHITRNGEICTSSDVNDYTSHNRPIAWTCPAHDGVPQCKNPLYVDDDRVHLTRASAGMMLTVYEQSVLASGDSLISDSWVSSEFTYRLPTDLFVTTLLSE